MRSVWALAVAGLMCFAPFGPADAQNAAGMPIAAVWKEQRLNFFYMGRTSRYSCEGLRDKVRAMLLDLGARRDIRVTALDCEDAAARPGSSSPSLTIVVSTLALPGTSAKPLRPGDLAAVDARFENFTITSDAFLNMGIADC
jgi:hypothetical protein